ncbi:phage tail protein [Aeromonas hydrophila]|uniref:phage tail-collar fiber domain-containing protein n=1 Tax=Aeromonas hydrophila TaxID=644 RepID=UPI003D254005
MSQVITNAFEQYWQSSLAAEQPVVLDEFILADIPNLDITSPIDPVTGLPPESQIVHRQNVDQRGRINNNAVAYTIVMDTTVGDFSFNAMYLRNKQNGVIGMIVYKGRETKLKTDQTTGQTGNSLVKSMLMGYDQAAEATLTNVDAGTWQIDYAARLRGQDEDLRQLASQLYGHHTFIGDGFKVVQQDGGHQVTQGVAIVGGLRIELKQDEVIHPGTKPIGVWVDVHRSGSLLSEHQNHFTIITSVADLTDHVDSNGYPHYVAKLGIVQADSTVIDGRGQGGSGGSGAITDTLARLEQVDAMLATHNREALRRSYAEAGYNLVTGSFEKGGTANTATDVLIYEVEGKAYSWDGPLPVTVGENSTPATTSIVGVGGWIDRSPAYPREKSVVDYGATPATEDNTPSFNSAQSASKTVKLPIGEFGIGTTQPDYNIQGDGLVKANGVKSGGGSVRYNPARESIFFTPLSYQREVQGIKYPPPRGDDYIGSSYNFVFSLGSQLEDHSKNIRYVTALGDFIGCAPIDWGYTDAFGGNVLSYAGYVDRTVALGSESLAWFGAPNKQWLRTYQHDFWRKPQANPYEPGEPGWDAAGLETLFPGIGVRLAEFADYSTDSSTSGYVTTAGRNAFNHLVKGIRGLSMGYGSGQHAFVSSYCVNLGALSGQNAVFGDCDTRVGDQAGRDSNDTDHAVFIGYGAARTVQRGSNSIFIGSLVADGKLSAENSILIGPNIAKGIPEGELDDVLAIGNTQTTPLIAGDFLQAAMGVNIQPKKIRARQHIRVSDSSSALTPQLGALLEGTSAAAFTVETNNAGYGGYRFADPQNNFAGGMEYAHSSDSLNFVANGSARIRIDANGHMHPTTTDNVQNLGKAANRYGVVYAGTGTINTSDGTEKTPPVEISTLSEQLATAEDRIFDAWGDVSIIAFRWLSSLEEKGEAARWHFGVIAQQVRDAFDAHGIDGCQLGLLCYDEWKDRFGQVQTNIGEKVLKTRQFQRTVMTKVRQQIVVEKKQADGSIILVTEEHDIDYPVMAESPIFDKHGNHQRDEDGNFQYKLQPVTEDAHEEYLDDAEPEFETVLEVAAGSRWGIRPDQCLFLEAAYQRRCLRQQKEFNEKVLRRIDELEGR